MLAAMTKPSGIHVLGNCQINRGINTAVVEAAMSCSVMVAAPSLLAFFTASLYAWKKIMMNTR